MVCFLQSAGHPTGTDICKRVAEEISESFIWLELASGLSEQSLSDDTPPQTTPCSAGSLQALKAVEIFINISPGGEFQGDICTYNKTVFSLIYGKIVANTVSLPDKLVWCLHAIIWNLLSTLTLLGFAAIVSSPNIKQMAARTL